MRSLFLIGLLGGCGFAAVASLAVAQPKAGPGGGATLPKCTVALINESRVSAQEAGILTQIEAKEGRYVEAGALLGQIDDSTMVAKKKVAEAQLAVAKEEASNSVNVEFAKAATAVAKKSYELNLAANQKFADTKSKEELQRLWLDWKKSSLSIDQASMEQRIAGLTANARVAEVDASEIDIERRKIRAPISGEIVEVVPHAGEWVNPGAPVVHIVQLDKMNVEGWVDVSAYSPTEVIGKPVRVKVTLERNRTEEFSGKIVFCNPVLEKRTSYRVKAEVVNRRDGENGPWLLRPGQEVEMVIDVGGSVTAESLPGAEAGTSRR